MSLLVSNLNFGYNKKEYVLKNISFEAKERELIALLGPNGCGKTTLIKCINRILNIFSGSITLDNHNLLLLKRRLLARLIAYVPQILKTDAGHTVLDMIIMGRKPYIDWRLKDSDIDAALKVLQKLNMECCANIHFPELSGGQKQKILIARALVQDARICLFDEPISFLDIKNQLEIMNMLRDIVRKENKTVIMVVHDLNTAYRYSDKTLLLQHGKVHSFGNTRDVLTRQNIKSVYGIDIKIIEDKYIVPA